MWEEIKHVSTVAKKATSGTMPKTLRSHAGVWVTEMLDDDYIRIVCKELRNGCHP